MAAKRARQERAHARGFWKPVSSGCVLIEAKVRSQVHNATRSVFVILEFEQDFIKGYSREELDIPSNDSFW